ncbi:MAG: hypothetical protein HKL90_00645 [Elusimicrobia bacterium]|nr:hypothetical protein [Elusimicrobiota bacterium]
MSALKKYACALAAAAVLSGCAAVDRMGVSATRDALVRGRTSVLDEPDYDLAREAAPAQMKLIETLLASAPRDRGLLRLAAESFGGGAFLFYEDAAPARAKGLYRRGRDFALAALARRTALRGLADKPLDDVTTALEAATVDDAPDLFWAAFCWAGEINLSRDDPAEVADLPKAAALMARAAALEPGYHFDGTDLFFGIYYASRPPLLGGDPKKALKSFEAARKSTQDRYLMNSVMEARWYAVAAQDKDLFKKLLDAVAAAPAGTMPEARLTDEAAKRKAAVLLEKIDDYF